MSSGVYDTHQRTAEVRQYVNRGELCMGASPYRLEVSLRTIHRSFKQAKISHHQSITHQAFTDQSSNNHSTINRPPNNQSTNQSVNQSTSRPPANQPFFNKAINQYSNAHQPFINQLIAIHSSNSPSSFISQATVVKQLSLNHTINQSIVNQSFVAQPHINPHTTNQPTQIKNRSSANQS